MSESLRELLQRSADRIDTRPTPEFLQTPFSAHSERRRRPTAGALAVALVAAAVVAIVVLPRGGHDDLAVPTDHGDLTDAQFALATRIAQDHAKSGDTVTGAVARVASGVVRHSNTGHDCASGMVLTVSVYGDFPHIEVSPDPFSSEAEDVVTALRVEADPDTGEVCLSSVATAAAPADPRATLLYGSRPSSFQAGLEPATSDDLVGSWTAVQSDGAPRTGAAETVTFAADGTLTGTGACEGRWTVPATGHLTTTGCDDGPVPTGGDLRTDVSGDSLVLSTPSGLDYFTRTG